MLEFKRERREKKDWTVVRPEEKDLSPFHLQDLADFLYCQNLDENISHLGGLHIYEVYFTADGNYWFKTFPYEGKLYSRLDYKIIPKLDFNGREIIVNGVKQMKVEKIGLHKNLIVECLDATEIIDRVKEWKASGDAVELKIVDKNDLRPNMKDEDKMISKWFNKEGINSVPLVSKEKEKIKAPSLPKLSNKELVERQKKQLNKK